MPEDSAGSRYDISWGKNSGDHFFGPPVNFPGKLYEN